MSNWTPLTLQQIPGVTEALNAASSGAGILTKLLTALSELLESLATIVEVWADLISQAMTIALTAIQLILNSIFDLLNTGAYYYQDLGAFFRASEPDGYSGFIGRLTDSFDDLGDTERPVFSDTANVSAVIFMVGCNSLPELSGLLALLYALFGIPAFDIDITDYETTYPEKIETGMSTPPDWENSTFGDALPLFDKLKEVLEQALGLLSVGSGIADVIRGLADVIQGKADALAEISGKIQDIIDSIQALIESAGLYILSAKSTKGIEGLKEELESAEGSPQWNADAYTLGSCMLTGGPAGSTSEFDTAVSLLFGIV